MPPAVFVFLTQKSHGGRFKYLYLIRIFKITYLRVLEGLQEVEEIDENHFKQKFGKQMNHVSQTKGWRPDDLFRLALLKVLSLMGGNRLKFKRAI